IFRHVINSSGEIPPVIDSEDVLEDPESILSELCESIGIPFSQRMLSWDPGPRSCDGLWGKYWYDSVWKSSGFSPPSPKAGELSEHLYSVLEESTMIYEELREMRIRT
ncbi:MAG TPA: HAD family hydrolase, partial [Candidatus Poseidoniales archaeon]